MVALICGSVAGPVWARPYWSNQSHGQLTYFASTRSPVTGPGGGIKPTSGFSVSASPTSVTLLAGGSSQSLAFGLRRVDFAGPITFGATGLPPGVGASFKANPTSASHMTLKLTAGAVTGPANKASVTITATARSSPGKPSHSLKIHVTVKTSVLRALGLEVTQGVQYDTGSLVPSGLNKSGSSYSGVGLAGGKLTIVRFFAGAHPAPKGVTGVSALLHAYVGAKELSDSPIFPDYGPGKLIDTGGSGNAPVSDKVLENDSAAYTFILPWDWTQGTVKLVADVIPPLPNLSGSSYVQQCGKRVCASNSFTLKNVKYTQTIGIYLNPIKMVANGAGPPSASRALYEASAVFPLGIMSSYLGPGLSLGPYEADVNITSIVNEFGPSPTGAQAAQINSDSASAVQTWADDNGNPSNTVGVSVAANNYGDTLNVPGNPMGVFDTPAQGGPSIVQYSGTTTGTLKSRDRPLTSVAHELGHQFGLVHASNECGGGQDSDSDDIGQTGQPWPPDRQGELNGIALNTTVSGKFKVIANNVNGNGLVYDFMSYCANIGKGDFGDWISPRNWQVLLNEFTLGVSPSKDSRSVRARATARPVGATLTSVATLDPSYLRVLASVTPFGVRITSVGPRVGPALAQGSSAFTLIARGANGQVLASVPLAASFGHSDQLLGGLVELSADVPSAGVDSVQITDPTVVASRARPTIAPQVRMLAPAPGAVLGGGRPVRVRWTVTNPEQSALAAQIDYSSDGGVSWRTIYVGPNSVDGVLLPSFYLPASHDAMVRVRINDGFNEAAAVSAPFTALDTPPQVAILSPVQGESSLTNASRPGGLQLAGDARLQLAGQAFDQLHNTLTGGSLHWFDGPLPLGIGPSLSAGPLPPGINHIRLVARDAAGHVASATVAVTVIPIGLPLLALRIPANLSPRAHQLRLGALSAVSATLIINRLRFALKAHTSRLLRVPIPPGTAPLFLHMAIQADQTTIPFAAVVRRHSA